MEDVNIRISRKAYKFIKKIKDKTGISIKAIVENLITGGIKIK